MNLIKLDSNGNIIWSKIYGGSVGENTHAMVVENNSYVLFGKTSSFGAGGDDAFVVKVDKNGNIIWSKTYGTSGSDYLYSGIKTSDNGYVLVGFTRESGSGKRADAFLVKTDINGNLIWSKIFGTDSQHDFLNDVIETSDGSYLAAGYTMSFGAGSSDFLLLKIGPNGEFSGCNKIRDFNLTVLDANPAIESIPTDIGSLSPYTTSQAPSANNGGSENMVCISEPFPTSTPIPTPTSTPTGSTPTPTPTSTPSTCSYSSTQVRVQPNSSVGWSQSLTINPGDHFNIGGFHNGTGQFSSDVSFAITGDGMDNVPIPVTSPGTSYVYQYGGPTTYGVYTIKGTTTGQSGPNCEDSVIITVTSTSTPTPTPTSTPKPTSTPTSNPTPTSTPTSTSTPTPEPLPGDVDGDGVVNAVDLGIIIDNYGLDVPPGDSRADLDHNNIINAVDLGIVIDNYGKTR